MVPLHAPFDTAVRGFHRRQVLDHVDALEARLGMVVADRDNALRQVAELTRLLDHLRQESADARARLERVQASPGAVSAMTERLHRMMTLAEDETGELRVRANREIAELRRSAEAAAAHTRTVALQEAERVRTESARERARHEEVIRTERAEHEERIGAERAEQQRAGLAAADQRRATIREGRAESERLVREATEESARIEAEAEDERIRLDQELVTELARRRTASDNDLHRRDQLSTVRSTLLCGEVQRRLGELDRRSTELTALHHDVVSRFTTVRTALTDAADVLDLPPRPVRGGPPAAPPADPPGRSRRATAGRSAMTVRA